MTNGFKSYRVPHPDLDFLPQVRQVLLVGQVELAARVLELRDVVRAFAQRHLHRGTRHHFA